MTFVILAFLAVFLLIGSGGLLLFYREVMLQRISEAINPRPKEKNITSVVQQAKSSIGNLMGSVENLLPKSEAGSFDHRATADARGVPQRVGGQDFLRHARWRRRLCWPPSRW